MKKFYFILSGLLALACSQEAPVVPESVENESAFSLSEIAKMISSLPLERENLTEVFDAVNSSSDNGYDEEYMMKNLFLEPGSGVGQNTRSGTVAKNYARPLKNLIEDYLKEKYATKSGAGSVEAYMNSLAQSDIQIYWPYSENWDMESLPVVTYDPGYGAIENVGYVLSRNSEGFIVTDSLIVDEEMARERPVWVINRNDDSMYTPVSFFEEETPVRMEEDSSDEEGKSRRLVIKSFKMLRQYDSWFGGASEFFIKCGAVDGFRASDEEELKLYTPSVTDMMVVVRRNQIGLNLPVKSLLLSEYTSQMEEIAFLIHEDDGGERTSWKCSAVVKIKSKSTGFEIEIPYRDRDDIVWRGQLAQSFFKDKDEVRERFSDVEICFELR